MKLFLATAAALIGGVAAAGDSEPMLSFALAPPANPLPTLTSLVNHLEARNQRLNDDGLARIQAAFDSALKSAKAEIDAVVGSRKSSFLQSRSPVRVKVLSSPGVSQGNIMRVEQFAAVREGNEQKKIAQAAAEFGAITRIALSELRSAMGSSFLKSDPTLASLNVQLHSSKIAFPTVVDILRGMEMHRSQSDNALAAKVLDLQTQYMKALNEMIASALH